MMAVRKTLSAAAVVVVLMGLGVGARFLWFTRQQPAEAAQEREPGKLVPVSVTPARQMKFETVVTVSGNVQAKNFALVSARIPGPLDAVYVDEGDHVEEGKTELFQTDSLKLTKAVAIARQGVTVAELSVREKEASLEQVKADLEQSQLDLARYQELVSHNAIAKQLFDQQVSRNKQAAAMVKHAEASLELERTKLQQAHLSLTMAEKDLGDSRVVAPISGWVSKRYAEPGEMAAAGTPVLRIEDLSVLEISVFLPAEYFARIEPQHTHMRVEVGGQDLGLRTVSYRSPTIHSKLRTFEVHTLVESPPPGICPGCLAQVTVVLDQRTALGVPSIAVVRRGDREVVFVVDSGKAESIPIKTGGSDHGWTEIVDGDLSTSRPVVSIGQNLLDAGTLVSVVGEAAR